MNKLMIAAAAVAMIGAAQANVVAKYDFVASLETTRGASGEASWVKYHAEFAVDKNGAMWYNDDMFDAGGLAEVKVIDTIDGAELRAWANADVSNRFPHIGWTIGTSDISGKPYPAFELKTQKVDGVEAVVLTQWESDFIEAIESEYCYKSFGFWCCQLEWYLYTPARCFRVVGADAIETEVFLKVQSCCDYDNAWGAFLGSLNPDVPVIAWDKDVFANGLFNRFGAQAWDDADELEIYAAVTNVYAENNGAYNGYLAGQGSLAEYNVKDSSLARGEWTKILAPAQLAGKIVGYTAAPRCPDCCLTDLPKAIAFECLDNPFEDENLPTASFGSFYIQIKEILGDLEK